MHGTSPFRAAAALAALALWIDPACGLAGEAAGDRFPRATLASAQGGQQELEALRGRQATVLVFLSTECPISNGYVPTLNDLARTYRDRGVAFVGLNPNARQSLKEMEAHRREYQISFAVLKDAGATLAGRLGVDHCPTACLFDAAGTLRYQGRIDDRYTRRGGAPGTIHRADLEEALQQVLRRQLVTVARTEVTGCPVQTTAIRPNASVSGVTYSTHVAAILQKNCQQCHRAGGIGPFELATYDQALAWSDDLRRFTADRTMPPWKPVDGWGDFVNRRAMTREEIETIDAWVRAGCPEGDASLTPPAVEYVDGWTLGEPDLVLSPPEQYTIGADGRDEYRCFVLPTSFPNDRHVVALEVRPGNARVVHHVIAFIDTSGRAAALDGRDPRPGYATTQGFPGFFPVGGLGGWAPGNTPERLPDGMAKVLPQGATVVMQVHYHRTGKPETDRTRLGLHFAKTRVTRGVRALPILPPGGPLSGMAIPAGAANHEVRCAAVLPIDVLAVAVTPHMHLLGKDMQLTATLPDGRVEPLMWVQDWDFNWQETYKYRRPVALPKGTRLDLVAHFDNSPSNPNNPRRPPQTVRWGEQTFDEMCIAFLEFAPQEESDHVTLPLARESLRFVLDAQAAARPDGKVPPATEALLNLLELRLKLLDAAAGNTSLTP